MKKFIALLLAALMCMSVFSALAEIPEEKKPVETELDGGVVVSMHTFNAKIYEAECEQPGTIERLDYTTAVYGDGVTYEQWANVYLPYGYDPANKYNILYFFHGTNETQNSFIAEPVVKNVIDNMIYYGVCDPFIIVCPTYYYVYEGRVVNHQVFPQEVRNDLMPAVESKYATFAETADDAGFAASREHRAFAGLSRGAVTTANSVLCGSLDYFSRFGLFSSFRTTEEHIRETIRSEEQLPLSIDYLYATTGNFDFATPYMAPGYRMLCELEPRLQEGVNTSFDIFPMRYHSIGHWHLSLYNFLQKVF